MHQAKILADSSANGYRLTTFELTYPRIIHAEIMTHRIMSRNAASSRAIPVDKLIRLVEENPYIPTHWGKNQRGMQAEQELTDTEQNFARIEWLKARDLAIEQARKMLDIGVHKQITNRLLEPFQWYTVIVSATDWQNFLNLRCHKDAHPEIRKIAELVRDGLNNNEPKELSEGEWHLPLIWQSDRDESTELKKISTGRCARVSYLTHDGRRDHSKDIELHDRLLESKHMSPFEHIARPMTEEELENHEMYHFMFSDGRVWSLKDDIIPDDAGVCDKWVTHFCGNVQGFIQYRKEIPYEHDALGKI